MICHNNFAPILGLRACEQMQVLKIKHENFEKMLNIENDYIVMYLIFQELVN